MQRHVANTLLSRLPLGAASFATVADYGLTIKQAGELVKTSNPNTKEKEVGFCAGIPLETYSRKVRIYVPARTASQQGTGRSIENAPNTPLWKLEFETQPKWVNPLIGWTSTADPLENVARTTLNFYTKEEAARFCAKHGWQYTIDEPNIRRVTRSKRYNAYGDNFSVKRHGLPDLTTLRSNQK